MNGDGCTCADPVCVCGDPPETTGPEMAERVLALWDRLDGWIPGASYKELAAALEVPVDRLLRAGRAGEFDG